MPRHGGATRHTQRRKHAGHRMHRKTKLARIKARLSKGRDRSPWRRGVV